MAEKKNAAQFNPMTSTQAAIGGGALIGFFALWFLWAAVGESVVCWIESHPGMASWVQAVGSIVAIFATAIGTRWQIIKSKKIQEENEVKNNIQMSDACLEMCNAVFSIMQAKEGSGGIDIKVIKKNSSSYFPLHDFKSLERIDDLQETLRLLLMKDMAVDLMRPIFSLQKIVVQYKEFIKDFEFNIEPSSDSVERNKWNIKRNHRGVRDEVNKVIEKIVVYKKSLR